MPTTRATSTANVPPKPSGKLQRSAPSVYAASTSPGAPMTSTDGNPYHVDFVIPLDLAPSTKGQSRTEAEAEAIRDYERLLETLKRAKGLSVTCRSPPKDAKADAKDEIWVLVSIQDWRLQQLIDAEVESDTAHLIPSRAAHPTSPTTRLRFLHSLLTSQMGITPKEGEWRRVKAIVALHDEEQDKEWLDSWKDWRVGLLTGIEQSAELAENQPISVHLYFAFLHHYTLSLMPLSLISILFYIFSSGYSPIYSCILVLYGLIFTATWRVKQRKLAFRWGTAGSEEIAVTALRPQFAVTNSSATRVEAATDRKLAVVRDFKMASSVPLIVLCGIGLGGVMTGIFVLEAFVGQVWDGFGKDYVSLVPTLMFVGIVPNLVSVYKTLAELFVKWENHPTVVGAEKSLTAKVFAMNAIVAYLGLFLSACVYVPFGEEIMAFVQTTMDLYTSPQTPLVASAEKTGLGPKTGLRAQKHIKADRLKNQLFTYTVTNQIINAATEVVLPFVMRFVKDLRSGKTTLKTAYNNKTISPPNNAGVEARFLAKVDDELALPDYAIFNDYAEMVTQFGYVTLWSVVWPLAPVFALINNYVELRADAVKICKHVRRPVGDRVESIGAWLQTLSVISWLGSITNAVLIYLFNSSMQFKPTFASIAPVLYAALAGSHAFMAAQWIVDAVVERLLWSGSDEDIKAESLKAEMFPTKKSSSAVEDEKREEQEVEGGFWDGAQEGVALIRRNVKNE